VAAVGVPGVAVAAGVDVGGYGVARALASVVTEHPAGEVRKHLDPRPELLDNGLAGAKLDRVVEPERALGHVVAGDGVDVVRGGRLGLGRRIGGRGVGAGGRGVGAGSVRDRPSVARREVGVDLGTAVRGRVGRRGRFGRSRVVRVGRVRLGRGDRLVVGLEHGLVAVPPVLVPGGGPEAVGGGRGSPAAPIGGLRPTEEGLRELVGHVAQVAGLLQFAFQLSDALVPLFEFLLQVGEFGLAALLLVGDGLEFADQIA